MKVSFQWLGLCLFVLRMWVGGMPVIKANAFAPQPERAALNKWGAKQSAS